MITPPTAPQLGDVFPLHFDDAGPLTFEIQAGNLHEAARRLRGHINLNILTGRRIYTSDSWATTNPAMAELWLDEESSLATLIREDVFIVAQRSGQSLPEVYRKLTPTINHCRHPIPVRQDEYIQQLAREVETHRAAWTYELSALAGLFDGNVKASIGKLVATAKDASTRQVVIELIARAEIAAEPDPVRDSSGRPVVDKDGRPCFAARHFYAFDAHHNQEDFQRFTSVKPLVEQFIRTIYNRGLISYSGFKLSAYGTADATGLSSLQEDRGPPATEHSEVNEGSLPTFFADRSASATFLEQFTFREILAIRQSPRILKLHETVSQLSSAGFRPGVNADDDELVECYTEYVLEELAKSSLSFRPRLDELRQKQKLRQRFFIEAGALGIAMSMVSPLANRLGYHLSNAVNDMLIFGGMLRLAAHYAKEFKVGENERRLKMYETLERKATEELKDNYRAIVTRQ